MDHPPLPEVNRLMGTEGAAEAPTFGIVILPFANSVSWKRTSLRVDISKFGVGEKVKF